VAALAARLAGVLDWGFDRVALLNEAALVHDVGKLGVPDAVLLKPGPLTELEYAQLKLHPVFSAQIVEDVLRPEQVAWIRAHHERPDGSGYPDGITELPGGAALLTLADAWDVMTVSRAYSPRKDVEQALEECQVLVGHQFTAEVVEALEQLYRRGVLSSPSSGLTQT
jgi:HD-GYP domain-containing protein (c-di-GMP phosphodiesterase class II)